MKVRPLFHVLWRQKRTPATVLCSSAVSDEVVLAWLGPGAGQRSHRACIERVSAVVTDEDAGRDLAAVSMLHHDRFVAISQDPFVAPLAERRHHRQQGSTLVREEIVVAAVPFVVRAACQDAGIDEGVEAIGEHVAGDPSWLTKSSKRRTPRKLSRRISKVHHSPTILSACATEQFISANDVFRMQRHYPIEGDM